jgi:membrane protein DedA with SNARE-associated domain
MTGEYWKALAAAVRVAAALLIGYAVWWMWATNRPMDDWYISIVAGVIVTVIMYLMLSKLKTTGD